MRGSAVSTPDRNQSPNGVVTLVSFTRTAQAAVGGTALDVKFRVSSVGAFDVAVSKAAPLPPTSVGLRIVPVRTGKPPL